MLTGIDRKPYKGYTGVGTKTSEGKATETDRPGAPRPQPLEGQGTCSRCSSGQGMSQGSNATTSSPYVPAGSGENPHHDDAPLAGAHHACQYLSPGGNSSKNLIIQLRPWHHQCI